MVVSLDTEQKGFYCYSEQGDNTLQYKAKHLEKIVAIIMIQYAHSRLIN
jgi:hypothetical protein